MSGLKKILNLESKTVIVCGKELKLHPFTLAEIADAEEYVGANLGEWKEKELTLKSIKATGYFIWLAIRQNGLNQKEIDNEEWKLTPRQVLAGLKIVDQNEIAKVIEIIFEISGLKAEVKNVSEPKVRS